MVNTWELVNGPEARRLEVSNAKAVLRLIEHKLASTLESEGADETGRCRAPLSCADLKEIHATHTNQLLERPGAYRTEHVHICAGGRVVHDPPREYEVPTLMEDFEQKISEMWRSASATEIAGYALWRINYIHPFVNGNGRTARSFTYAVLCTHYGFVLPGKHTIVDMITETEGEYYRVLARASDTERQRGWPDLRPIQDYIAGFVIRQLASMDDPAEEPASVNDERYLGPIPKIEESTDG